jgi:hypothetical protein
MDRGAVATQGPIAGLKGHDGRLFELRVKGDAERFLEVLRAAGLECHATDGDVMRVFAPDARVLFQLAARHGMQVRHLRPSVPTLEDVFTRAVARH